MKPISDDIMSRLRRAADEFCDGPYATRDPDLQHDLLLHEAADEIERLRDEVQRLAALVNDLYSDEECDHDHHGYCQTHMWFNTDPACPHVRATTVLAAYEATRKEADRG